MSKIDTIISEYARLRNVDVSIILEEVANEDEATMNQLFLMACALEAVA
jgi:hypothetical protein